MSAFALAVTSRSPLTRTGTASARTPHSSTVPTGSSPFSNWSPSTCSTRRPITSSSSKPVKANELRPQPTTRPSPSHTKKAASGAG